MILSIKDVANAPQEWKAELKQLLDNPILITALYVLEQENMPSFAVRMAPGMDAMQSVALDYAQRCGAQAIIKRLKGLPFLTAQVVDRASLLGKPWEYLTPEESVPEPAKKTVARKPSKP